MELVIPTIKFISKDIPFIPDKWYIIAGGVDPKLVFVKDIIEVNREEEETIKEIINELGFSKDTEYELARTFQIPI
jgi:hypothetical protein